MIVTNNKTTITLGRSDICQLMRDGKVECDEVLVELNPGAAEAALLELVSAVDS